jgi:hypothetical protein
VLGVFSDPELAFMDTQGSELDFALDRILDGIAQLVASKG